ncbi:MAG: DUF3106 domain-containing protein [Planctomycetota bacterium]
MIVRRTLCRWFLLGLVVIGWAANVGSFAAAQDRPGRDGSAERVRSNRERWAQLDEDQRQVYRRLHRALEQLPPSKRQEIRERLRGLRPEQRRRLGQLLRRGAEDRFEALERHEAFERFMKGLSQNDELRHLRDEGRADAFREHFHERMLERARRRYLRDLPESEREEFLALSPEAQSQRLRALLGRGRGVPDRLRRHFLESLPEDERLAFEQQTPEQQEARLRQFGAARRQEWIEQGLARMRQQMSPAELQEFEALSQPAREKQLRRFLFGEHRRAGEGGEPGGDGSGPPWLRRDDPDRPPPPPGDGSRPPRHSRRPPPGDDGR